MNTACCDDFESAQHPGTDNEMYGSLIHNFGGKFEIGHDLPTMRFCPWCGRDIRKKQPLEIAARVVVRARYKNNDWSCLKEEVEGLADALGTLPST